MLHSPARLTRSALIALLLVGLVLAGCAPQPTVTAIPPATVLVGPMPPTAGVSPATAGPPIKPTVASAPVVQATQAPAAQPTAAMTVAAPAAPTRLVPTLDIEPHKPVKLTLLHTNDVFGEIDPCG